MGMSKDKTTIFLFWSLIFILLIIGSPAYGQIVQKGDVAWKANVQEPAFLIGSGPRIRIDAGHGNWHTESGRFKAFSLLASSDGFQVSSHDGLITEEALALTDILVIANAAGRKLDLEATQFQWVNPIEAAFNRQETALLRKWVEDGGSLLLIADHAPFAGAMDSLAAAFDLVFLNGYAMNVVNNNSVLRIGSVNGSIPDHPIFEGRNAGEKVTSLMAFGGQAFRATRSVDPLLVIPEQWQVALPTNSEAKLEDVALVPARGLLQGAAFQIGSGRVAVFGEAAMFTAQTVKRGDGSTLKVGMNNPEAGQNQQFTLNVLHWLADLLNN